jgi:hypothetical protein
VDSANEAALSQTIDQVANECALLIIAHRFSTIRSAEQIVILDDGEVSAVGTHAETADQELLPEHRRPGCITNSAKLSAHLGPYAVSRRRRLAPEILITLTSSQAVRGHLSRLYARPMERATSDLSRALDLVADGVRAQECILFLGAGVHAPPPAGSLFAYPPERRPPIGTELSRELARRCGLAERLPSEDPGNLQRVALAYEIAFSRFRLIEAVTDAVHLGKEPSPTLRALARLNFPVVITTNYDQLFEQALRDAGKQPRVAIYTPKLEETTDFRKPTAQSPVVFKIHGDISRPETVVITDEDYIDFVLRMSNKEPYDPLPRRLKVFLTDWTTLFVGYSLLDYNLRLLFKTLRWKIDNANLPEMYSVDLAPDPLIMDVWQSQRRYVKFIAQDVWAFVPRLYELVHGEELSP